MVVYYTCTQHTWMEMDTQILPYHSLFNSFDLNWWMQLNKNIFENNFKWIYLQYTTNVHNKMSFLALKIGIFSRNKQRNAYDVLNCWVQTKCTQSHKHTLKKIYYHPKWTNQFSHGKRCIIQYCSYYYEYGSSWGFVFFNVLVLNSIDCTEFVY